MRASQLLGRCLVTGTNGFIGRRLIRHLKSVGIDVTGWARSDVDLLNEHAVSAAMSVVQPEYVFHIAACGVGGIKAHDPKIIGINCTMSANILAAMPEGSNLIVAGTMSEYGGSGRFTENSPCHPTTAYGIAKLASTEYLSTYAPKRGVNLRVARIFGAYGPGESQDRLFPTLLKHLKERRPVDLSDGQQKRDFVHVDDVCNGLIRLASPIVEGQLVINLGSGIAVRVGDVCRWIAQSMNIAPELLRFGTRERSPGDADLLVADTSLLQKTLQWAPPQRFKPGMDIYKLFDDDLIASNSYGVLKA